MTIDEELLARIETLRIPLLDPLSPLDWKDWYHFVLINQKTGMRLLVNITMMGRPDRGEIQVTLIFNLPSEQITEEIRPDSLLATFCTAFSLEWKQDMVRQLPLCVRGDNVYLEINGKHSVIEIRDQRAQLLINFQGEADAMPLLVTEASSFGSGFIGWGLIPGFQVTGELSIGGQSFSIDRNFFCYHDRNFGRFRWGEDIGWEWLVAIATCEDGRQITLILDRRTNKDHLLGGLPYIFIYIGKEVSKIFLGASISINWEWSNSPEFPLRLPGIMASLFCDRSLRMPQTLQIEAADEQDRLLINIDFDGVAELIVPDNQGRQYTFIEELTGSVKISLCLRDEILEAKGFVYAEYVH